MLPGLSNLEQRAERFRCAWRWIAALGAGLSLVLALQTPALAQIGSITGQVIDAEVSETLSGVQVELQRGATVIQTATTDVNGGFTFTGVPDGRYSLLVSALGYETQRVDDIRVRGAATTVDDISLVSRAFQLNPIVVTASRSQQQSLEAPASVFTIDQQEIALAQPTTTADYVLAEPGVSGWRSGVQQHNIVTRGFNNVFSGALYILTDNRWASVPSLRLNAYNLIPVTNDDLERIEVVLGPGSALYGPNVDQGVMHMITSSPLDKQETLVSVTGGARAQNNEGGTEPIWQGTFRQAGLINENVGYKISASYLNGTDWIFNDPVEQATRAAAIDAGADSTTLLIGARDFTAERVTVDGRVDFRVADTGRLMLSGGTSGLLNSIELTGIGGAQAKNWFYSYAQARFRMGALFAQTYLNFSNSGDSFTLRDGMLVSDKSKLWAAQIQYGNTLANGRQVFTYGFDSQRTLPDTDGTIHGDNEDTDNIWEVGGYLQSQTAISDQWDVVLAGRVDWHDVIDQVNFSPRAAIIFKPQPGHAIRGTYNRAFSNPTSVNLFLDLQSSPRTPSNPFGVFAAGVAPQTGYEFARDSDGAPLMRTFWDIGLPEGEGQLLPLDATLLWDVAVGALIAQGADPSLGFIPAPTSAQVGTQLRALNTTNLTFEDVAVAAVTDIPALEAIINNTFEAGYKGVFSDRLLVSLDAYYTEVENFISPLRVETPNVFLDPVSLEQYLANFLPAADAAQLAAAMGGISGSSTTKGIPLGTVTPVNTSATDPADVLLTYRQFSDKIDYWGIDIGAELLLADAWSVFGSYTYLSDSLFTGLDGVGVVSMNAPQNQAALGATYSNPRIGLNVGLRGRWLDSFFLQSGVYVGQIDAYAVGDLNIAYALPFQRNAWVTLTATNFTNNKHKEVIGAPQLASMYLLRFRYTLP